MAAFDERFGNVRADETRAAGHEIVSQVCQSESESRSEIVKCRSEPVSRILCRPILANRTDGNHSSSPDITGGIQQPTRRRGRAVRSVSLFGLAPCGVWPATSVTSRAVGSYRTFSPLPSTPSTLSAPSSRGAVYFLCHFPSGRPARVLPGALPCGVRTFLSRQHFAPLANGYRRQRLPGSLRRKSAFSVRPVAS